MAGWAPLYATWHNFDRQTGIGIPDTMIDAEAAENWDLIYPAATAYTDEAVAGLLPLPSGATPGYVATVGADGNSILYAASGGETVVSW